MTNNIFFHDLQNTHIPTSFMLQGREHAKKINENSDPVKKKIYIYIITFLIFLTFADSRGRGGLWGGNPPTF